MENAKNCEPFGLEKYYVGIELNGYGFNLLPIGRDS